VQLPAKTSGSTAPIGSLASNPMTVLARRILSGNGGSDYCGASLTGALDANSNAPSSGYMVEVPAPGSKDHPNGAWSDKLPFDIRSAAEAESAVGKEMLARLEEDTKQSAMDAADAKRKLLHFLHGGSSDALRKLSSTLLDEDLREILKLRLAQTKSSAGLVGSDDAPASAGDVPDSASDKAIELALSAIGVPTGEAMLDEAISKDKSWLSGSASVAATWNALVGVEHELLRIRDEDQSVVSSAIADLCAAINDTKSAPTP